VVTARPLRRRAAKSQLLVDVVGGSAPGELAELLDGLPPALQARLAEATAMQRRG
jgi:hypothetical protein